MPNPVYSVRLPYKVRCDLCHRAINLVFKAQIDKIMCTFCSTDHANIGFANWQEKKNMNITQDKPNKQEAKYDAGNIPEEER